MSWRILILALMVSLTVAAKENSESGVLEIDFKQVWGDISTSSPQLKVSLSGFSR